MEYVWNDAVKKNAIEKSLKEICAKTTGTRETQHTSILDVEEKKL